MKSMTQFLYWEINYEVKMKVIKKNVQMLTWLNWKMCSIFAIIFYQKEMSRDFLIMWVELWVVCLTVIMKDKILIQLWNHLISRTMQKKYRNLKLKIDFFNLHSILNVDCAHHLKKFILIIIFFSFISTL